jgi:hypothetical protein
MCEPLEAAVMGAAHERHREPPEGTPSASPRELTSIVTSVLSGGRGALFGTCGGGAFEAGSHAETARTARHDAEEDEGS